MNAAEKRPLPPMNPFALGPLDNEAPPGGEPAELFPGETRFLAARHIRRRIKLVDTVAARVSSLIEEGERILYIAPAASIPPVLHQLGLGLLWQRYYTVALVITDRRVVELLLADDRVGLDTRVLSYPFSQVRSLSMRMLTLTLRPLVGRSQKWRVSVSGDRRLLRLLVPRLVERVPQPQGAQPRRLPLWHCPSCGAQSESRPRSCRACGTEFSSPGLAAGLALAIPGGGLFYTKHHVLGALDLVGEAIIAVLVWVMLLFSSGGEATIAAVLFGAFLFALTKLESAHLSQIMASRTLPMAPAISARWRRAALAGAVLTAAVITAPLMLAGSLMPRAEHDLDFAAGALGWSGGHDPSIWEHGNDEAQRSEWVQEDGWTVFVFTRAFGPFESFADVRSDLSTARRDRIGETQEILVAGMRGIRVVERVNDDEDREYVQMRYFLDDEDADDVHILIAYAKPDALPLLEERLGALLATARLVPAIATTPLEAGP